MSERLPVPKLDVALRTLRPYWLYELFTTNCRRSRARTSELEVPPAMVVRGSSWGTRVLRRCVSGCAHLRVPLKIVLTRTGRRKVRRVAGVVAGAGARRAPLRVRVGDLACARPVCPPQLLPLCLISRKGAKPSAVVCSGTDSATCRVRPDSRLRALPRATPAKPWRRRTVRDGTDILQRTRMCGGLPLLERRDVSRTQPGRLSRVGLRVGLRMRRPMGRGAGARRPHHRRQRPKATTL